ncbi:MAG: threonine/serine dehydratase [Maricaulis sp.]|uniref:threonine ammonia-lyase n=1 Tax=Maricaulis sp. TaxID=1486257 RepID=UPI00261A4F65|nr:threonine/serine dehydratase [Maricaulis sp.]MDM7983046.1 threonine/serine dehydratase [Maricaulis sp.]
MAFDLNDVPAFADIEDAAARVKGVAVETPLLRSDVLDAKVGGRVFVKPECLQRTGSFKFRGAYNRISRLCEAELARGVVAYSSGNHAQGVAAAARLKGSRAKILMPGDAPAAKVEGVLFWGGEVVFYDRATENREEIGTRIAVEEGRTLVPPYEDKYIIAGQGTTGLELMLQARAQGQDIDTVVCCAGGGGLIAGVGLAARTLNETTQIWAAEPVDFDDMKLTFETGQRVVNKRMTGSICDAIITPTHGELTWALNAHQLSGGYAVSDDEVLDAMAFAWRHFKLVVEPGGAVALASILSGKADIKDRTSCAVLSGGNVDPKIFQRALERVARI